MCARVPALKDAAATPLPYVSVAYSAKGLALPDVTLYRYSGG